LGKFLHLTLHDDRVLLVRPSAISGILGHSGDYNYVLIDGNNFLVKETMAQIDRMMNDTIGVESGQPDTAGD
jgi:hypothetical protein